MAGKSYATGIETRKLILRECRRLFLEKGYNETSYDDICAAAHVNRGSVHYHFRQKANIRYEVLWDIFTEFRHRAEPYTARRHLQYLLANYRIWEQIIHNAGFRRFLLEYSNDNPVYAPDNDFANYIRMIYLNGLSVIRPIEEVSGFLMGSVYGYLHSLVKMVCEEPERYEPMKVYTDAMCGVFRLMDFPKEEGDALLSELTALIGAMEAGETGNGADNERDKEGEEG